MGSYIISANSKCKNRLNNNRAEETTTKSLQGLENRVQLTSVSVSTKGEKQAGTIQLSKYVVYLQDKPKVCTNCIQTLRRY